MASESFPTEIKSFWKAVEEYCSEAIPSYLKQIITAAGYDRYSALKYFTEEMQLELERFARENVQCLFSTHTIANCAYLRNPEKFKLVPGHTQLLKEISKRLPDNPKHFEKVSDSSNLG